MILGSLLMKKHKILFNMINNSFLFSTWYCSHSELPSVSVLTIKIVETEMISMTTEENVSTHQILRRDLEDKTDDFLQRSEKKTKNNY